MLNYISGWGGCLMLKKKNGKSEENQPSTAQNVIRKNSKNERDTIGQYDQIWS